ncbi:MAG TPA: transcription termination/antitermination protein NusG [Chitinophagaceae bacterium]|nr:MAG: NusG antitermination factor [Bacteroidetes bacterium OLB11]HMN32762.1 transcription termination/antitermination protein NusG [Chitinophagaceae bacterium]
MEDHIQENTNKEEITSPEKESKWYVLRVLSGKERKVKEYLDIEIKRSGWSNVVTQVLCPVEKVFKVVSGKKVMREKILYPGYILLESPGGRLSDTVLQTIKKVSGVIHFLGKNNPDALRKSEVNKMFGKMDEMAELGVSMSEPFIVGETIKIIEGPFNDFNGTVEEVNEERKKLKVIVKIFGRPTPVELTFLQVEKVS